MTYKRTITYTIVGEAGVADAIEDAVKVGIGEAYGRTFWNGTDKQYTCATGDGLPATIVAVNVTEEEV